jgi:hypothetical protein
MPQHIVVPAVRGEARRLAGHAQVRPGAHRRPPESAESLRGGCDGRERAPRECCDAHHLPDERRGRESPGGWLQLLSGFGELKSQSAISTRQIALHSRPGPVAKDEGAGVAMDANAAERHERIIARSRTKCAGRIERPKTKAEPRPGESVPPRRRGLDDLLQRLERRPTKGKEQVGRRRRVGRQVLWSLLDCPMRCRLSH